MDKLLLFPGKSDRGVFTYLIDAEKNYLEKHAAEYHPTIAAYVNSAKPIKGKTQILLTALGAGEWWGCFLEGTPVLLGDGTEKPIEQIEEGDLVWTHKNRVKPVVRPMGRHYSGMLYRLGFRSWGVDLECTDEHPIYGVTQEELASSRTLYYRQIEGYEEFVSRLEYGFRPAKEWRPGDYVCVPYPTQTIEDETLCQEGWAYLMGWYLAEGTLVRNYGKPGRPYNRVIWTLSADEGDVALRIKSICAKYDRLVQITEGYGETNCIRVEATWTELARACDYYIGHGARTKRLSTEILVMPREWQLEFLSAYLDGDGCQTKGRGRYHGAIRSSTASRKLAVDLCKLTARVGHSATFFAGKQHHSTFGAGNPIYENTYERDLSVILDVPSFEKVTTSRRSTLSGYIDRERGYILVQVKEVSSREYEGDVFNLEVAEDNSYCVNSFAVHNCNVNGDYFPETALAHEGTDYGYKTFEHHAKIFKHHVNKDPAASYGDVALSVYNPTYHRVELILMLDNAKAPDIAQRMDQGDYPDWSMGAKVPYDVCCICGNKAPTRKQYCEHLRYYMGRIHPETGRMAYAINPHPKFFDISQVLIGADRIAKTHLKVAHSVGSFPSSAWLAEKMAESAKAATIEKEIPADTPPASQESVNDLARGIMEVKAREPSLPRDVLNTLGKRPFGEAMTTLAMLGILPKPQEFQRIVLVNLGAEKEADELDRRCECFDPMSVENPDDRMLSGVGIDHRSFSPFLSQLLMPFLGDRSYAAPLLGKRLTVIIKKAEAEVLPTLIKVGRDQDKERKPVGIIPMLALAAGLYAAFSKKAPTEAVRGIDKILATNPGLAAALGLGLYATFNSLVKPGAKGNYVDQPYVNPDANDIFARIERMKQKPYVKVGSVGPAAKRLLLGIPGAYMASGVLQKHKELNPYDEEGRVKSFIRRNPDVVSGALIADAMLSARGGGTHGLARKGMGALRSYLGKAASALEEVPDCDNVKVASASEFLSNALIWPLAGGKTNLPARVVSGLFDQAVMDAGAKLLEKKKPKGDQGK